MNDINFKVVCQSCETVFEVTDPNLVGQIVACPKCGGMILIEAPSADLEHKSDHDAPSAADVKARETVETSSVVPPSYESPQKPIVAPPKYSAEQIAPPVIDEVSANDIFEESKTRDDLDSDRGVWRFRLILVLSGVVCALLLACLAQVFLPPIKGPAENGPADVSNEDHSTVETVSEVSGASVKDSDSYVEKETTEEEADGETLVRPTEIEPEPEEFDPSGAALLENLEDGSSDVVQDENGDSSENEDLNDVDLSQEDGLFEERDRSSTDNDFDSSSESAYPSSDGDDRQTARSDEEVVEENGELPTEFDEEEEKKFEKANDEGLEEETDEEEDLGAVASTTDASLQASLPTLKISPKEIDIDSRMKLVVRSVTFPESPVAAIRLLSELTGVPIEFDLANFELMRAAADSTLKLSLENVSVETALKTIADLLKWRVDVQNDRIVLSPLIDEMDVMVEEEFDVADLLADKLPILASEIESETEEKSKIDALIRMLRSLTAPSSWNEEEGGGSITGNGSKLIVKHNALNRKKVGDLLDRVRALHGLETIGETSSEKLIPETLGWERLTKTISFNLLRSTSLQQAIEIIEKTQKLQILWDDATLNEYGVGRDSTTLARVNDAMIEQVLFDLLEPLKLTYLILDENLFLITTKEKAEQYKTVEIHMYASPEEALSGDKAKALVEEMKLAVAPKSWNDPDVALWLDEKSQCWIVRQSQPVQRELRRWTSERVVEKITAKKAKE